jgi:hypothetical protein
MTVLLAVDPGLRGCGAALFFDGALTFAHYVRNPNREDRGPAAWRDMAEAVRLFAQGRLIDALVLEVPQVYTRGKGDPGDLVELAGVDGAILGRLMPVQQYGYKPREWKGSVPKDIHHARVRKTLTEAERQILENSAPASLRHNVLDAIALGKWWLAQQAKAQREVV